ncbi:MAG: hypothetical protein D6714_01400, partial [Bacteroidetes bacterium]
SQKSQFTVFFVYICFKESSKRIREKYYQIHTLLIKQVGIRRLPDIEKYYGPLNIKKSQERCCPCGSFHFQTQFFHI